MQQWDSRLLGISLDLPSVFLNASEPFQPPSAKQNEDDTDALELSPSSTSGSTTTTAGSSSSSPFLWQAPNSNAVLYTGQKWVELHDFVSRLLETYHGFSPAASIPASLTDKLVSKRYPAWLEHVLKLARARGYWVLYPGRMTARNLATVHGDLHSAPEEYRRDGGAKGAAEVDGAALAPGPLLESLPDGGGLPAFSEMPLLRWDGAVTGLQGLDESAAQYAAEFRAAVTGGGGCEGPVRTVGDLFCAVEE